MNLGQKKKTFKKLTKNFVVLIQILELNLAKIANLKNFLKFIFVFINSEKKIATFFCYDSFPFLFELNSNLKIQFLI